MYFNYEREFIEIINELESKFQYLAKIDNILEYETKGDPDNPNLYSIKCKEKFPYTQLLDKDNKQTYFTIAMTAKRYKDGFCKYKLVETWTYPRVYESYGYDEEGKPFEKNLSTFKYIDDIDYIEHYIKKTANIIFALEKRIKEVQNRTKK